MQDLRWNTRSPDGIALKLCVYSQMRTNLVVRDGFAADYFSPDVLLNMVSALFVKALHKSCNAFSLGGTAHAMPAIHGF